MNLRCPYCGHGHDRWVLDLFSGAGGASMGYHCAGFGIVGVDIVRQPRYPFVFVQGDVLRPPVRFEDFAAVHASPPCQFYSALAAMHPEREWPNLIPPTREMLMESGHPRWVMENVPLLRQPGLFGLHGVELCGSMFGLGVARGQLRRHRLFESTVPLSQPPCRHRGKAVGVYGHGGHSGKHRMLYRQEASDAMGIDWMNRDEMTQAIPPAYTAYIGGQIMEQLSTDLNILPDPDMNGSDMPLPVPLPVPRTSGA